jgi:hypothetical protein
MTMRGRDVLGLAEGHNGLGLSDAVHCSISNRIGRSRDANAVLFMSHA